MSASVVTGNASPRAASAVFPLALLGVPGGGGGAWMEDKEDMLASSSALPFVLARRGPSSAGLIFALVVILHLGHVALSWFPVA